MLDVSEIRDLFRTTEASLGGLLTDPPKLAAELARQHAEVRFASVDFDLAWLIGSGIRAVASEERLPIAINITLGPQQVFHAAVDGATSDNDDWAARKSAVAWRYSKSSFAVGLDFADEPGGFDAASRRPVADFAAHGGAVPILLRSGVAVGVTAVSGLPATSDHALVIAALTVARDHL
ncbi:UPF0303 protein R02983 [Frondihabitans sucicola]|uniref:UPF0303 protein R02983 n=1 Tax=Frondihabitans sucicola TaxID=1268041 RepID=A0ABN6XSY3_9MICO|nr:heme-binding protein [Frondihabitans sucicola]BDZ47994.1 UPF0303 protein R02983 [Frondihabitans sucicola]